MATTAKIPEAPGILKKAKLGFQREIKTLQTEFNVPEDLILNFDQTPLTYICSSSHTLHQNSERLDKCSLNCKGEKEADHGNFYCH